jgi:hypothetical protein
MDILQELIDDALLFLTDGESNLRIDNIILGKSLYTMKDCDQIFTDMNFCLVLLESAYGFSYFQEPIDYGLSEYVNMRIPDVLEKQIPGYLKVALADSLYCLANSETYRLKDIIVKESLFIGGLRDKAQSRAVELINLVPMNSKVLLLGAVTEIIQTATQKQIDLTVLDLHPQKIGLKFGNTCIGSSHGQDILCEKVRSVDCVIATGMIFASNTADEIFQLINENGTRLIMFMETGANFGPQLLDFGADAVLSEYFPYYDFFGDTRYSIFKRNLEQ